MSNLPPSRAHVPAESQPAELPSCLECGACCFSQLAHYVPVSGSDYTRFGAMAEQWVEFDGYQAHLRMHDGHCAALHIESPAGVPRYVCQVYEVRPSTCRTLERGGAACKAERELKAARALISAERLCRNRVTAD